MNSIPDQNYYIEKLYKYADKFKQLYREKKYPQAKYVYDSALRIAPFLEVPQNVIEELFGQREESYLEDAAEESCEEEKFPFRMANRCYEICTIQLYQGYEHEAYRSFGQPPRYYPQPRYPVEGMPQPEPSGAEEAHKLLEKAKKIC